ncbi:MAG: hypothetical protein RQ899_09290 [Pseudomonadales bacterium]|nr:hypothetical protein [Pseudomonadales bacterium]
MSESIGIDLDNNEQDKLLSALKDVTGFYEQLETQEYLEMCNKKQYLNKSAAQLDSESKSTRVEILGAVEKLFSTKVRGVIGDDNYHKLLIWIETEFKTGYVRKEIDIYSYLESQGRDFVKNISDSCVFPRTIL